MKELEERQKRYTKMLILVHNLERHYGSMTRVPDNNEELKKLRKLANLKAYEDKADKKKGSATINQISPVGKVVA